MTIEYTINELYNFFDLEKEEDIRNFSITKLNKAYLKKRTLAYTDELKEKTKNMYNRLYSDVVESLKNFMPYDDDHDMKSLFD